MRFGSLFSGIGGFDLGFERAGMTCAWQCEINRDAQTVLKRHWPEVKQYGDIRALKAMPKMQTGKTIDRVSPSAEWPNGAALMVQGMFQRIRQDNQETQLQQGSEKAMATINEVQPNARTVSGSDHQAEWAMCNLPKTDEAPIHRSLSQDRECPGYSLPPMQRQTGNNRGSGISAECSCLLEPVDVITAGFPCQDLSVAGKRAGLEGQRSGLFFEAIRIVQEMREATDGLYPTFLVLENVPGLLSSNRGRDFAVVIREMAESGALDIGWSILDAQWFGVAQRRRRVFIVADFRGQRAGEILSIPYGGKGHPAPSREKGKVTPCLPASGAGTSRTGNERTEAELLIPEVAGTLGGGSGRRGWCNDLDQNGAFVPEAFGGGNSESIDVATTLSTKNCRQDFESETFIAHTLSARHDSGEDGTGRGTPIIPFDTTQITSKANRSNPKPGDPCPHVATVQVVNTLRANAGAPKHQADESKLVCSQSMAVRRLTPTECERLMAFPDGWTDAHSDSARYRMLGNAVVINVAEWIGRRIKEVSA